jgi:hypothetical protein
VGVGSDDDGVFVGLVYKDGALGAGFVAEVEAEFVAGVEFPSAFVLLEGEAEYIAELVSELMGCVVGSIICRGARLVTECGRLLWREVQCCAA